MAAEVAILLATYNGQTYLINQLESFERQRDNNWRVYVRDDRSADFTRNLIKKYVQKNDRFFEIKASNNIGYISNFECIAKEAYNNGEIYFFFSDQDDIWESKKLSVQSSVMERVEASLIDYPVLVYSDMTLVDASGSHIAESFMQCQGIYHTNVGVLNILLAQNFITGCASMLNRELMRISLPFPKEAVVHDWWVALCAAAMGHIEYIDEPLVKYRQHANNQIGASHWSSHLNPFKSNWHQRWLSGRDNLKASMLQARALAERVKLHYPNNENIPLIEAYADLINVKSGVERVRRARALGVRVQTPLRYGLFLSRLLFLNGK